MFSILPCRSLERRAADRGWGCVCENHPVTENPVETEGSLAKTKLPERVCLDFMSFHHTTREKFFDFNVLSPKCHRWPDPSSASAPVERLEGTEWKKTLNLEYFSKGLLAPWVTMTSVRWHHLHFITWNLQNGSLHNVVCVE